MSQENDQVYKMAKALEMKNRLEGQMNFRDQMACAAMGGLIASSWKDLLKNIQDAGMNINEEMDKIVESLAITSYRIADKMIEESCVDRSKKPE